MPPIEAGRYALRIREPEWFEHRLFKGPDTDINLHVFTAGCSEIERMLGFRDWLRTHDDDRLLYERTKRELATRTWRYMQHYADAKNEVVDEIAARAGLGERFQPGIRRLINLGDFRFRHGKPGRSSSGEQRPGEGKSELGKTAGAGCPRVFRGGSDVSTGFRHVLSN